ncbi:hypothetical protein RUM43_012649 [Polyplax serrata]|uniref:Uncharacterized protein n=1 Tax=Polyplax serrata TaxID=468196 RepID=A0AAN8P2B1_POLSC
MDAGVYPVRKMVGRDAGKAGYSGKQVSSVVRNNKTIKSAAPTEETLLKVSKAKARVKSVIGLTCASTHLGEVNTPIE